MSESPKRRERRLQEACGDLGRARVTVSKHDNMIYKVVCRECAGIKGTTYRSGHLNDYMTCLSRWNRHLAFAHPGAPAPPSLAIEAAAVERGYVYVSVKDENSAVAWLWPDG